MTFFFTLTMNLFATTYYVDNKNGNDDNTGTGEDVAWRTIDKVNGATLNPGDTVRFRRGGIWRGNIRPQAGEAGKPITYSTYGEGAKPVIMGSVPLTNESDWNRVPGRDNIWVTNETTLSGEHVPCPAVTGQEWSHHCDGNGKITFEKSEDGYCLTCLNSGERESNIQLILAPLDVPAGKAFVFRFRAKATKPFALKNVRLMMRTPPWSPVGHVVPSEMVVGTGWQEYELVFFTSVSEPDGRITFFIGHDFPEGCVLSFVPLEGYFTDVISNGINVDVGNMILIEKGKNEKFAGFKRWSIDELEEEADFYYEPETNLVYFRSEVNPAVKYRTIEAALKRNIFGGNNHLVIDGFCMINGAAHGVGAGGQDDMTVRNCEISWIGGGHLYTRNNQPTRYGNGVEFYNGARNCLVENNVFSEIYDVAMTIQGPDKVVNENIVWRNNVVHHCEQAYEIWFTEKDSVIRNVLFENNTCVEAGHCWGHRQRPNKRATHLLGYQLKTEKIEHIIRNNVFTGSLQNLIWYYNDRIAEFDIDDNIWWDDSVNGDPEKMKELFSWDADKNRVSFDNYRKLTGNDSHSKMIKPVFADPEHFDYRILNRDEIGSAGADF